MSIGTKASRSSWSETLIIVVEALAIAMFVRIFFYQPFNIPSGSMKETLADRRLPVRLEALLRLQQVFLPLQS